MIVGRNGTTIFVHLTKLLLSGFDGRKEFAKVLLFDETESQTIFKVTVEDKMPCKTRKICWQKGVKRTEKYKKR